ncbi:MAG: glycosyltransferase family 4 protein [Bacteroidetes bacterium]|nr:glycosyltransferase family 4 protein [Bacteroidota bacterium]
MENMLTMDRENEYVLFYRNSKHLGKYISHSNVKELFVDASNKIIWDQIKIPAIAKRERCDVIFNTKFTVPFFTRCKTIMSIHGASWFVHPELYSNKFDLMYIKAIMPLYCKKVDAIISNSDLTRNDYIRLFKLSHRKVTTAHLGRSEKYCVIDDISELHCIREKYSLPEKFILSVVKYDPRKNFKNLIEAFRTLRRRLPAKLVVVGKGCDKYIKECGLDKDGTVDDVIFTGWVDQTDLPAMYNLAHCMFFPSVYEEFGIPTCESMACGCPPVVSKTGALPEIVGDAGLIVDPFNPIEMADALEKFYTDDALVADYKQRCLKRAEVFTWENCAQISLNVINQVLKSI